MSLDASNEAAPVYRGHCDYYVNVSDNGTVDGAPSASYLIREGAVPAETMEDLLHRLLEESPITVHVVQDSSPTWTITETPEYPELFQDELVSRLEEALEEVRARLVYARRLLSTA